MKQENFFERKKLRTVIITNSVTVNKVSSNTLRDARNHALHDFVPEFSFFLNYVHKKRLMEHCQCTVAYWLLATVAQ